MSHWQPHSSFPDEIVASNNQLILRSRDAGTSILVLQKIQTGLNGKKLRLRAILASKDVIAGEKSWHKARLLLVQYIDKKAQWTLKHTLAALEGTQDWQSYDKIFSPPPEYSEIHVIAQTNRCSGEFLIKDLTLYEVEETSLYILIKWPIKAAWILFIFVLWGSGLKRDGSTLLKIILALTVVGIVIGTNTPGQYKNELKESITQEVDTYTAPVKKSAKVAVDTTQDKFSRIDITKIGHFGLFSLLALLLVFKNPFRPARLILLELLMFACATELMQFYVDGRSPLVTDVLIDMGGSVIGVMTGRYLFKRSLKSP